MKILINYTTAVLLFALAFNSAYSQKWKRFNGGEGRVSNAKERLIATLKEGRFSNAKVIATLKKVKLLEKLELDEKVADKFLVKYSSMESKTEELKSKIGNAVSELTELIAKDASKDDIVKKTNELQKLQKDFSDLLFQNQQEMKSLLNEIQFAKYLVFEHQFVGQVQKIIMKNMKNK